MSRPLTISLGLAMLGVPARAQDPLHHPVDAVELRFSRGQPVLSYTLTVDPARLSGFGVELKIRNAPDSFRLAMAAHPEYDDQYWRYLRELRLEAKGPAQISRADSALWRVSAPGGEVTVHYRLELPPSTEPTRSAWQPFLAPTGGLVGGPHSFLYLVGATLAPVHVRLELPAGWDVATGLESTSDPGTFFAPTTDVLVDSPILIGKFRTWRWSIDGVPHRLVYWPLPDAVPFDTVQLVSGLERITRQTVQLFGRPPYREYSFLVQDGAGGALEHLNSLTLGASSSFLARNPVALLPEIGHEFMHTWNLMRIRPAEYRSVDYRTQPPTSGLWFSEGLSMFYADVLLRRAGLPTFDSTRATHLERLLVSYLANPGNSRFSAEQVSRVAYNASPGALGDYGASTHLQGELLGTMLDLIVRDATGGRRSMDDVMRAMLERFSGERGFLGADIQRTVTSICSCDLSGFFAAYVRNGTMLDFNRYLALAGLRAQVTRAPALSPEGRPVPDLRIRAWMPPAPDDQRPSLLLGNPTSAWGLAGLHTGDRLVSVNGTPMPTVAAFRAFLGRVRLGDTLQVEVLRTTGSWRTTMVAAGYDRPRVSIEDLPQVTARQRALRDAWRAVTP